MKKFFLTLLLTAMMCVPFTTSAQVTIGSGNPPSQWSLLDLDNRGQTQPKALHLPRMNSADRDALAAPVTGDERREPQRGLMIFNIENNCLEVWNGEKWLSFCEGDESFVQPPPMSFIINYPYLIGEMEPATGCNGIITYQWQSSIDGGINWDNIVGVGGNTHNLKTPIAPFAGYQIILLRRQATCGGNTITSQEIPFFMFF